MAQKFKDNGRALLTASIAAGDLTLTVEASKADRFPVATTVAWGTPLDWFKCVLIDSSGNREVIKVGTRTSGSGVFGNLLRAQDGTIALTFTSGSVAVHAVNAADVESALAGIFPSVEVAGKMKQAGLEGRFTPVGGIIMWSGTIAAIPAGWSLCNGLNGTPDLRDRFIVGARQDDVGVAKTLVASALSQTGGTKDAVLPSHSHSVTATGTSSTESTNHTHGVNDPGHAHTNGATNQGGVNYSGVGANPYFTETNTGVSGTGISLGFQTANHTHITTVTGTAAATGVSGVDQNLVPYFALAYIMCLAV